MTFAGFPEIPGNYSSNYYYYYYYYNYYTNSFPECSVPKIDKNLLLLFKMFILVFILYKIKYITAREKLEKMCLDICESLDILNISAKLYEG
jgi:hypothetical protein